MNPRVLIVDDSLTVRMDLEEGFAEGGFRPILCNNLASARQALQEGSVALVILDMLLPDGEGVDLVREIRSVSALASIPIIVFSREAEMSQRLRGLETGADEYVGKPYDRQYLVNRARQLLGRVPPSTSADPSVNPLVLVIDDSPTFREEFKDLLESRGYRVATAATGEEGLGLIVQLRPHAVVVDGILPGIDGATAVRRLRSEVAVARTPCLLLTGSSTVTDELLALEAGADSFLGKDAGKELILARLAALLRVTKEEGTPEETSLISSRCVLAVDDSPTFLQELTAALREERFDAIQARSGDEALQLLPLHPVDCVILDLVMPGLSGEETCRLIKNRPEARDIPVMILTSQKDPDVIVNCLEAGADDFVPKSAEFDILKARLRAQIRRKQFKEENRRIRQVSVALRKNQQELAQANREMFALNLELEQRVEERTVQLRAAHAELEKNNSELKHLTFELEDRNEELQKAILAKDRFLATMSHELRTPLNAVIGFTGTLLMRLPGPLNEDQEDQLRTVESSATHLLSLINDLLDLAKIESGKVVLKQELVSCQSVIREIVAALGPQAHSKGLRLEVHVPPGELAIPTDRRALTQILLNLTNNAIKFTETGTICVDLTQMAAEGAKITEIRVSDTGIGIRPEDQGRLFRAFEQIEGTRRNQEGTGLGLHLSQKLAHLIGGQIDVISEFGKGSKFTLVLKEMTANAESAPANRLL